MTIINGKEYYEIHVATFNAEHKTLVIIVNKRYEAM